MKKLVLLLAAAGLASATAITFTNNDTGVLFLASSMNVNQPVAAGLHAHGSAGAVGGMCVGIFSNCPATSGATPDSLTFTLASAAALQIQLQDRYNVGDVYDVILNGPGGTQVFQSSVVNQNGTAVQSCYNPVLGAGQATAANSCLNTTTAVLAPGSYSITVWDIILSYVGDPSGDPFDPSHPVFSVKGGWNPASYTMDLTLIGGAAGVPEPATLGMLGLGGIVLGLLRLRFRK
ncbi:MAG TPA: PEP-CTERM sorting domain-containing protein [Bryobacteraceae bacterium]|nr:PEP-CTERM sorting domain-containing protein [Bryobacteraceae bacterium]